MVFGESCDVLMRLNRVNTSHPGKDAKLHHPFDCIQIPPSIQIFIIITGGLGRDLLGLSM